MKGFQVTMNLSLPPTNCSSSCSPSLVNSEGIVPIENVVFNIIAM